MPVRYSYFDKADDKADIFAASQYHIVVFISNLILNSHDLLYFISEVYSQRFSLNLKGLSDGKVVSLTKKEYGSTVIFYKFL